MKNVFPFLMLIFCSCSPKTEAQNKPLPQNDTELQKAIDAGIDPYFVESTDTFSSHGPFSIVRHLTQDAKGNIWLASWQGIIRYDGKTFTNYTLKDKLIHFHVFYTFEDSKGNLWFSMVRGGVYKYNGKSFTYFSKKDGLGANTTSEMAEDKEGNIWFATEEGVTKYDGKKFTNYTTKDGLCNSDCMSIRWDNKGKLWIGTKEGISIYDGKTFSSFYYKEKTVFKMVASLFEDKDGNIWIGSNTGFFVYDGKKFSEPLRNHFVMYMCQDKTGKVWCAMNQQNANGDYEGFALCYYEPEAILKNNNVSFKMIKQPDPSNYSIFGMLCDKEGKIWFGTGKGICKFDPSMTNNACVNGTCKHEGSAVKVMREHEDKRAKAFTLFSK